METISRNDHAAIVSAKDQRIKRLWLEIGSPTQIDLCGNKIQVVTGNISEESFFERLATKSKQFSSLNHFIDAIEKL